MVMWNSTEPLSGSSELNVVRPMRRSARLDVDAVRDGLGRQQPGLEEPLDLVVGHGSQRVARQASELRIGIPAQHGGQVGWPVATQFDGVALDQGRVPIPVGVSRVHRWPMLSQSGTWFLTIGDTATDTIDAMREWSDITAAIASTRSTTAKVATVADYLRSLDDDALPVATVFLSGRAFPETDARTTGLGWRALTDVVGALAAAAAIRTGARPLGLGAAYDQSSDLGTAVGDLLQSADYLPVGDPPTLPEVANAFAAIAAASGAAAKGLIARALLERCDTQSVKALVKVLSGELRIGLRQGHLEAAIASAFGRDLAAVQWAGMLTGDIGRTAVMARDDAAGHGRAVAVPSPDVHARVTRRG